MRLPIQAQPVIRGTRPGRVRPQPEATWSPAGIRPAQRLGVCPPGYFSCNCAPCLNMCCTNGQTCSCSGDKCSCV